MAETDDVFDMQNWPIMHHGRYRAVDPPKQMEGLVVKVTAIRGEIECVDESTGRKFVWLSAAEFRKHHRPL